MKGREFTVLIVSRGGKAPVNFTVSFRMIYLTLSIFSLMLTGIISMYNTNHRLSVIAARMPQVTEENSRLYAEMTYLENELAGLMGQMNELEILGQEVRGIVSGVGSSVVSRSGSSDRNVDTEGTLDSLREGIPAKAEELEGLLEDVAAYKDKMEVTPDLRPTEGRITSPFGWRPSPFTRRMKYHNGIDIGASFGTPVRAAAAGKVVQVRYQGGFGRLIIINHGTYTTHYAHLKKFHVQAGDRVEKGALIGEVGSSGNSTGPHLHFEIHKNGSPMDPLKMIKMEVPGYGT